MRQNTRDSEKRNATTTDPRPSRILVGTDGEGCDHHFMPHTNKVVVVSPDGEPIWRQPLSPDQPIEQWLVHVGDRRGWADQHLYQSFGDVIAETVSVR